MDDFLPIILSVPEQGGGATEAATFLFASSGYKPPRQGRSLSTDVVHNQNGVFIYPYDNGPNTYEWDQFEIVFVRETEAVLGTIAEQWEHFQYLWNLRGVAMGMADPEAAYTVGWAAAPLERQFLQYPGAAGDKIEFRVVMNIEER